MGHPVSQLLCRACPAACGLALGAAALAPATTEAPPPLRISAGAAPAEVTYGSPLTLSGRVEGQAPAASMLALEANGYPYRAWHVLASTQLQPDGSFAFAGVRPQRNTRMRVLLEGAAPAQSASVHVIVEPGVAVSAAAPEPGRTRLGVRLAYSPRLLPRDGRARWFLAPDARRRFRLATTTPLRELAAGTAYAAATVDPPARSFSYRVCVDPGWGSAMGPPPAAPQRCSGRDFNEPPSPPRPLEYEGHARGIPLAPYPPAASIAAARRYLDARAGKTAFAVVDSAGRIAGVRVHERFQTASVVKVMMLIAYLQMLDRAHRNLRRADSSLLYPMIHNSDNEAASAVLSVIGSGALARVAREAGMHDFAPARGWWAFTQTSAADQAQLMVALGRLIPGRFYSYARGLLAAAAPSHSWGIPPVARPRWRVYFKTGSLPSEGLFNEVARLERPGVSFSVAVLTTGDPSTDYGKQTIAGMGETLLARAPY